MNLPLQCKNLKIKIRYTNKIVISGLRGEQVTISERKSCIIMKRLKTTVTIYKHSPHTIHVTGITTQQQLDEFLRYLLKNVKQRPVEYKVDNSMFSCKMNNDIDLMRLMDKMPEQAPYYCVYKRTIFPALFCKPKKNFKTKRYPTILIFRTGSFLLLGGTSMDIVRRAAEFVKTLIQTPIDNNSKT